MKRKVKINRKDLIETINFLVNESKTYRKLYELGIDTMNYTEMYNNFIHKQLQTLYGKNRYDWIIHYAMEDYDTKIGGYDEENNVGICFDEDSLYDYISNKDYIKTYNDSIRQYPVICIDNNDLYIIECVNISQYNKIFDLIKKERNSEFICFVDEFCDNEIINMDKNEHKNRVNLFFEKYNSVKYKNVYTYTIKKYFDSLDKIK